MASSLSVPVSWSSGQVLTAANLNSNFTAVVSWADAIPDGDLASPNNSVNRVVLRPPNIHVGGTATGTNYFIAGTGGLNVSGASTTSDNRPAVWSFASADRLVAGLTTRFKVGFDVFVGSTSPSTVTFQIGLYPITISSGNYTMGTVVTGSQTTSSGLATNTISSFAGTAFAASALLANPGVYAIGVIIGSITVPTGIMLAPYLVSYNS